MATTHSTLKTRTDRNRPSRTPTRRANAGATSKAAKRLGRSEYSLPGGLINAVEEQRMALSVALSLLTGLDAALQQAENRGGDILHEEDPADVLVLKARAIARPIHLVRLVIQRVYQAQVGLDSLYLERVGEDS